MRSRLFAGSVDEPGCLVQENPISGSKPETAGPREEILAIKKAIAGANSTELYKQLHPRLQETNLGPINNVFATMKLTLGHPFEVSPYRVWAANTVDGSPKPLPCAGLEATQIQFWPQYGFNLEYAVWFQVLGTRELGRVFLTLVPKNGRWFIGAFHYHQWTHSGKGYQEWIQAAKADLKTKYLESAYVKLDIAAKLVEGKQQFRLSILDEINAAKKQVIGKDAWEKSLRTTLKDWKVLDLNTILAPDGVGIIVRVEIPKEITANDVERDCHRMGKTLSAQEWFSQISGFKCSLCHPRRRSHQRGYVGRHLSTKSTNR